MPDIGYRTSRLITRSCQFCAKEFQTYRSDSLFCSPRHRVAFYRWRTKLQTFDIKARGLIEEIADYLKFPDAQEPAHDVLIGLVDTVHKKLDNHSKKE